MTDDASKITPADYVRLEMTAGRLTYDDVSRLTEYFQKESGHGLDVDGMPGPATRHALHDYFGVSDPNNVGESGTIVAPDPDVFGLSTPLPVLLGGRRPVITSGFGPRGELFHHGVDVFYPWRDGDKPDVVGVGLAADRMSDGRPTWVVPFGTPAIAAGAGVVTIAGDAPTGHRLWISLDEPGSSGSPRPSGWMIGYFHLESICVTVGQRVAAGQSVGSVGHNPLDGDARHLHFELSPTSLYSPIDPQPYVRGLGKWDDHRKVGSP